MRRYLRDVRGGSLGGGRPLPATEAGFYELDADDRIIDWSPTLARWLRMPMEDVIGQRIGDVFRRHVEHGWADAVAQARLGSTVLRRRMPSESYPGFLYDAAVFRPIHLAEARPGVRGVLRWTP